MKNVRQSGIRVRQAKRDHILTVRAKGAFPRVHRRISEDTNMALRLGAEWVTGWLWILQSYSAYERFCLSGSAPWRKVANKPYFVRLMAYGYLSRNPGSRWSEAIDWVCELSFATVVQAAMDENYMPPFEIPHAAVH